MAHSATSLTKVPQRRKWNKDEDAYLTREVQLCFQTGKSVDWRRVSKGLTNRSNKDCRKRWLKIDERWNQGQWSPIEDEKLREAVGLYMSRWKAVSDMVATRSPDQCAKRWRNSIDPQLKRPEWSPTDDSNLVMAVERYGRNWKPIVEHVFPGRSRLDLSNRYTGLLRRSKTMHRRTLSRETLRSRLSSPDDDESSSAASLPSPTGDRTDEFLSSSENLSWSPPTSQHAFPSLNSSIHHMMSPDPSTSEEVSIHHSSYDHSHHAIKVEDWPSPSLANIPTTSDPGSIMTSQRSLQGHPIYPSSYMPWGGDWVDPKSAQEWSDTKVALSDHSEPVYTSSFVPTTYSLENGHQPANVEHAPYRDDGSGRRTITIDNVDDSTRAVILDALCKGKKQVTLVLD